MANYLFFDWHEAKAASNLAKHGVSFEDAMLVFTDPLARSDLDPAPPKGEERWITVGLAAGRLLLVVHTQVEIEDNKVYIRIISARRPTRRERNDYENG